MYLVVNMARLGMTGKQLGEALGLSASCISFQCTGRVKVTDAAIKALRNFGDTLEPISFIDDTQRLERPEEVAQLESQRKLVEKKLRDIKNGSYVLK